MRSQDEIQNDIRNLRRQLDVLNEKVSKKAALHGESVDRITRQKESLLAKINAFNKEYMASLAINRY
jgi:hypothetical protein